VATTTTAAEKETTTTEAEDEDAPSDEEEDEESDGEESSGGDEDLQSTIEDKLTEYLEVLASRDYSEGYDLATGPAQDYLFYLAYSSQLELPEEFAPPSEPVEAEIEADVSPADEEPDSDGFVDVDGEVLATFSGDEDIEIEVYDISFRESEENGLVVYDFTYAIDGESWGPLSEDVIQSVGRTDEGSGPIDVSVGAGYSNKGEGPGGTVFSAITFEFTNNGDETVVFPTVDFSGLNNPAAIEADELYAFTGSSGMTVAPGETGYGWVMINEHLPESLDTSLFKVRFENEAGEEVFEAISTIGWDLPDS
jgi:hypothetical protein